VIKKSNLITYLIQTASLLLIILTTFDSLSQDFPSSKRSRDAVERVKPNLTFELDKEGLEYGSPIYIRIFKEEKVLEVWIQDSINFKLFKTYPICTYGAGGLGPKIKEGDGMAPEGFYFVVPNKLNPYSDFHLSFNLGYPNAYDRSHGRTGSALMVHGNCVSIGCYAMSDPVIEEIYAMVDAAFRHGQPFFRVHIFPFKMTSYNMHRYENSKHYQFWQNLKKGYDAFNEPRFRPPNVEVANCRYVFN